MEFFTIGVYHSTEKEFFQKLTESRIDTFCDVRQRRGVRGSLYAFVNSKRLQKQLSELGIRYQHVTDLAPSAHIRELQKKADQANSENKRDRNTLGSVFTAAYKNTILDSFDFKLFIHQLEAIEANRVVLFCVEEKPDACHRSIVSKKLESLGFNITHL